MSEFWKKRRPRLSNDEERALWERVRTMPSEAAGRGARARSPWAARWARPAVRFGAPVLAVALVAIVWVAQRGPEAPRPEATRAMEPMATTGPAEQVAPAPGSVPAPAGGREERAQAESPAIASEEAMDAAPQRAKEAPTFAAPPAAPSGAADRGDEATPGAAKVPANDAPAPTKVTVIRGGADELSLHAQPEGESATDPRVAAIRGGDYTSQLLEEVVRPSTPGAFGTIVDLPLSTRSVLLIRDERRRWNVSDDPLELEGSRPQPGPLERRAALAVELLRATTAEDAPRVDRVLAAALALQREQPADEGVRALVAWAMAARVAVQEP